MKLCAVCARLGRDCCHAHDICVSSGDVARIAAFSRRAPDQFLEFRRPVLAAYLEQDDDPNWLAYVTAPDGSRRLLRQAAGGSCIFLAPTGCELPEQVRPLICRLHPVEYTEAGITGIAAECPVEHLPPGEKVLVNLGIDLASAEGWRRQLYEELRNAPGGCGV